MKFTTLLISFFLSVSALGGESVKVSAALNFMKCSAKGNVVECRPPAASGQTVIIPLIEKGTNSIQYGEYVLQRKTKSHRFTALIRVKYDTKQSHPYDFSIHMKKLDLTKPDAEEERFEMGRVLVGKADELNPTLFFDRSQLYGPGVFLGAAR